MSRVLNLSEEITTESMKDIINSIVSWNLDDDEKDKKQKDFKRQPIRLLINTYGGDLFSSMGVASMIKKSKTPIYTYCIGQAMSGGFLIFIAGHKRYCYDGSTFLYHQISQNVGYKTTNKILNNTENLKKLEERYEKIILDNTKISKEKINEYNTHNLDWYISPDEAKELGIVDKIL